MRYRVSGGVFFMAAGVFYYFEEAEIKTFFIRLADRFPGADMLFDAASPAGVRVANQKGDCKPADWTKDRT